MLQAKELSIGYEGKAIVSDINFSLNKGDYLCIVGENGAGKSTLVKTLLNLQKPISGEVIIKGDGIGYLPQQTIVQKDFPASVWEIVLSGNLSRIGKRAFYSAAEKKRTKKNMERLGIWDLKKKCYRNLSGGQQQRVLLARALCASEELLFLDEPVTGLDPKVTAELYELIKKINSEGVTIIMVTHDMEAAVSYSSHILHLDKDTFYYGRTEEYRKSKMADSFGVEINKEDEQ